jgi:hypothetical protein
VKKKVDGLLRNALEVSRQPVLICVTLPCKQVLVRYFKYSSRRVKRRELRWHILGIDL